MKNTRLLLSLFAVASLLLIVSLTVFGQDRDTPTDEKPVAPQDQVVNDDFVVFGSGCFGLDCVNGENFSFDTLRLKENNLRIHFQDTSVSASFPTVDWRITINDSNNGGNSYFSIDNVDAGTSPLKIMSNGNVGVGIDEAAEALHVNGNVQVEGVVNQMSDRNAKENFTAVANAEILSLLADVEITTWNYINDPNTVHIGPMAQDFYETFGVGIDNRHISSVDTSGIALAAIQALNQQLEQKDAQISNLQAQNEELDARLRALEEALADLQSNQ